MDCVAVKLAELVLLAAGCAGCVKGSSKDDRATPTPATSPSEAPTASLSSAAARSIAVPNTPAPAPGNPGAPVTIDSITSARAAIGKRVRLEGTCDNAKLGAVVVKGELVVYCTDRKDGWDERNVPVVVEGALDYTNQAKARIGADGSVSAGTGGPIFQMTCDLVR